MQKIETLHGQGYVALVNHMGDDRAVINAARVSYNKDTMGRRAYSDEQLEKDEKLLRYLLVNRHTSPFEHVQLSFEVSAPIFVFRQWHRHRTWSYNEISARYTELPEEFYVPVVEDIGAQHKSNKQMRTTVALEEEQEIERKIQVAKYVTQCRQSFITYRSLIAAGWPRELARAVLPVSTFSRMVATVDLHNLMGFLRLRLHEHAQKEIQEYAVAMLSLMNIVAPLTTIIFRESLAGQKGYEHLSPQTVTDNLS
jgi:thymidylate synthase (FAD)